MDLNVSKTTQSHDGMVVLFNNIKYHLLSKNEIYHL